MKYTEIFRLKEMLEKANIPFEFNEKLFGEAEEEAYQIVIYNDTDKKLCDAIEHFGSYGHEKDLLEIMDAITAEERKSDDVLGWLTAEEVFKRFKYCYEHDTSEYVEEEIQEELTQEEKDRLLIELLCQIDLSTEYTANNANPSYIIRLPNNELRYDTAFNRDIGELILKGKAYIRKVFMELCK